MKTFDCPPLTVDQALAQLDYVVERQWEIERMAAKLAAKAALNRTSLKLVYDAVHAAANALVD